MEKKRLVRVFKEPETTRLYGDSFINHAIECFKGLITEMAGFFSTTQGFSCFNRQLAAEDFGTSGEEGRK